MNRKRTLLKIITLFLLLISLSSFQSNATTNIIPRTILHYISTGSTPSGLITADIRISVQDTSNQIIGVQTMDNYYCMEGVRNIVFTPITIASGGSHAFVGVSYIYKNETCSESIMFYP